jgi:serine/threonine protein kinase
MKPTIAPERWQLIEELFHSSLERDAKERAVYLIDACGDDVALRREVEALLVSYEAADGFIDVPPLAGAISSIVAETAQEIEPKPASCITPGRRIAHYEITSFLGAGGMGDVYLAHDLKLDRQIAIKILPARFIQDDMQVHRFEREARAASALNHPNIITIHEIGQDQNIRFIATEFVTGQTLREKIRVGGLDIREILSIAIQISDALVAAHAAGIVHRDIKPENVMIRPDGLVKVLDFGLAKPTTEHSEATGLSATEVTFDTDSEIIMGTLSYLSPEQVLHQEVDHRTDLFSFGVLLYEMVTGTRPFVGDSAAAVCSAILSQAPDSIKIARPHLPPALERIIIRALKKDRGARYQTASQLRMELERLDSELQGVSQKAWRFRSWRTVLSGAAVFTLILLWQIQWITKKSEPVSTGADAQVTIKRLTSHGKVLRAAISPDGSHFAYVKAEQGKRSLWLGQTSDGSSVPFQQQPSDVLPGTLIFSPDGKEIYYIGTTQGEAFSTLYRVSVGGGETYKVLDHIDSQLTFSPSGDQIAFIRVTDFAKRENALVIANLDGTDERLVAVRKWTERFTSSGPSWSPDGKTLAVGCITGDSGTADKQILAVRVSDGAISPLSREKWEGIYRLAWLPDRSGVIMVATDKPSTEMAQVWHLAYPSGKVHRITRDLDQYDQSNLSLSADGRTLLVVQLRKVNSIWSAPVGRLQDARQLASGSPGSAAGVYGLEWAPDGRILYQVFEGDGTSIWSMAPDGSDAKQITSGSYIDRGFSLSADGGQLLFQSGRGGALEVWRSDLDGSRAVRLTTGGKNAQPHISPNGRWVIYTSTREFNSIWRVSTDGGEPTRLTEAETMWPRFSPDGKLFACTYRPSLDKPWQLAVYASEGGLPLKLFDRPRTANFATGLRWTLDGQAITYRDWEDGVWRQPLTGEPSQRLPGLPKEKVYSYAWSPDGKYFAFTRGTESLDIVLIRDFN